MVRVQLATIENACLSTSLNTITKFCLMPLMIPSTSLRQPFRYPCRGHGSGMDHGPSQYTDGISVRMTNGTLLDGYTYHVVCTLYVYVHTRQDRQKDEIKYMDHRNNASYRTR